MLNLLAQFAATTAATCNPHGFLGLVPWYQYLQLDGNCQITKFQVLPADGKYSDIPLVFLALVDDLLRLAGLIAVVFVVYGGISYVTSQGNPDQASKAQSTILNALAGLAVAIVAVALVSYFGNKLG